MTRARDFAPRPVDVQLAGVNCGEISATYVQNFTVFIAEANFSVTLDAQATKIVEGTSCRHKRFYSTAQG